MNKITQTLERYEPFKINDCGVCVNPIIVGVQLDKYNNISCCLRVGRINGRWYTGYSYNNDDNMGGCSSPVTKVGKGFETAGDALQSLIERLEQTMDFRGRLKFKKTLEIAKVELYDYMHPQLTLF